MWFIAQDEKKTVTLLTQQQRKHIECFM